MIRKAFSAALLTLLAALPLAALADTAQQLVITLTDQTTQTFWLYDEPRVVFGTTDLTVTAGTTTYNVERSQVSTFTFSKAETEGVHHAGLITSTSVNRLYDLNGRLLQERDIDTSLLPAGTYILQTPGQKTVKITKQ